MAIVFEQKQKFNWKTASIIAVVAIVIGIGIYLLFFTPVPGIQIIVPSSVSSTAELSGIEFDPGPVAQTLSNQFKRYVGQPTIGEVGRINPFIKY